MGGPCARGRALSPLGGNVKVLKQKLGYFPGILLLLLGVVLNSRYFFKKNLVKVFGRSEFSQMSLAVWRAVMWSVMSVLTCKIDLMSGESAQAYYFSVVKKIVKPVCTFKSQEYIKVGGW